MILPDAVLEKLFALCDRSYRFFKSLHLRLSDKGRLSPIHKKSIFPDSLKFPVVVFSVFSVLLYTFTTEADNNTEAEASGPKMAHVASISVPSPSSLYVALKAALPAAVTSAGSMATPSFEEHASVKKSDDSSVPSLGNETPAIIQPPDNSELSVPGWTPGDITRGSMDSKEVCLTFDGGYNSDEAGEILDILKARGIKTTIFLTGVFMERFPGVTRRIVEDGHEVGNHLMTHPHLTSYSRSYTHRTLKGVTKEFLTRELREAENLFRDITGAAMAPLWRAPYGEVNSMLRRWAFEAGYVHVGWTSDYGRRENLDTLDWVADTSSPLYLTSVEIKEKVLSFGRGKAGLRGGIILMHLGTDRKSEKAVTTLSAMVEDLQKRGYSFIKVTSLIEGDNANRRALQEARNLKRERLITGMAREGQPLKGVN